MTPARSAFARALPLLAFSLIVHVVYLFSIVDIWFKSPVVSVPERYSVRDPATGKPQGLAKRVVLIVGDGLRADKLFEPHVSVPFELDPLPLELQGEHPASEDGVETPAPFLRSLIQHGEAQWGVSHTRVPTESRPGHVSIIGGMYEDVSAVLKGWKTNPVRFDSVFNQSSHAFTFGSPDILPMFKLGATPPERVSTFSYGAEFEDFTTDAVQLDIWVYDQLASLLHNATIDVDLDSRLRASGTVFFLHLLGLDTTGHAYRPHGPEYYRNIQAVDRIVARTQRLIDEFYGHDDETAWIFTADHGMSDIGNHGDGHPDNTRTPLVAWGKGIARTLTNGFEAKWNLRGEQMDVEQADLATFMSVLAGVPVPANAEGTLPLAYLSASEDFKARAALTSARQSLAAFQAKSDAKEAHALRFRPFPELPSLAAIQERISQVESLIQIGSYQQAQAASMDLAHMALQGSRYFHTYDWWTLQSLVTAGYLGWMLYSFTFIADLQSSQAASRSWRLVDFALFAPLATLFFFEGAPWSYYLYALLPSVFWSRSLSHPATTAGLRLLRSPPTLVGAVATLAALELMVQGYHHRAVFAVLLLSMGLAWPLLALPATFKREHFKFLLCWAASCAFTSVFPALPVERGESVPLIALGGALCSLLAFIVDIKLAPSASLQTQAYLKVETMVALAATLIACSSALGLQRKEGLHPFNQLAGWSLLIGASLLPFLQGRPRQQAFEQRIAVLLFAFVPPFVILSKSFEILFLPAFSFNLYLWIELETRVRKGSARHSSLADARIGLFFLVFLHVAFFGVGNVASISSFYLEPVYRLIPVFAPFPMAALLLYKLLVPFVALSAMFSGLNRRLQLPPFALFLVASTLADVLTLNFFFLVTDKGSWLEIGSSISHFAICSLLSVFNTCLFLLGELAVEGTRV